MTKLQARQDGEAIAKRFYSNGNNWEEASLRVYGKRIKRASYNKGDWKRFTKYRDIGVMKIIKKYHDKGGEQNG